MVHHRRLHGWAAAVGSVQESGRKFSNGMVTYRSFTPKSSSSRLAESTRRTMPNGPKRSAAGSWVNSLPSSTGITWSRSAVRYMVPSWEALAHDDRCFLSGGIAKTSVAISWQTDEFRLARTGWSSSGAPSRPLYGVFQRFVGEAALLARDDALFYFIFEPRPRETFNEQFNQGHLPSELEAKIGGITFDDSVRVVRNGRLPTFAPTSGTEPSVKQLRLPCYARLPRPSQKKHYVSAMGKRSFKGYFVTRRPAGSSKRVLRKRESTASRSTWVPVRSSGRLFSPIGNSDASVRVDHDERSHLVAWCGCRANGLGSLAVWGDEVCDSCEYDFTATT